MTSKTRLKQFIDFKGFEYYPFEMKCGLSNGALKKDTGVSSTSLEKIHNTFPELNMDWVITGRGEMIYVATKKNNNMASNYPDGFSNLNDYFERQNLAELNYGQMFAGLEKNIEEKDKYLVKKKLFTLEEIDYIMQKYKIDFWEITTNIAGNTVEGTSIVFAEQTPEIKEEIKKSYTKAEERYREKENQKKN